MTQRDLQELELAARMIIAVIERNHVSDEDATERRAKFILFPGGEKEKSPAVTTGGEKKKKNTALSFTSQEMEEMPNELKKLFITGAIIAHVRKNRGIRNPRTNQQETAFRFREKIGYCKNPFFAKTERV